MRATQPLDRGRDELHRKDVIRGAVYEDNKDQTLDLARVSSCSREQKPLNRPVLRLADAGAYLDENSHDGWISTIASGVSRALLRWDSRLLSWITCD